MKRFLPVLALTAFVAAGVAVAASTQQSVLAIFKSGVRLGISGTDLSDSYAATAVIDLASVNAVTCLDSSAITVTGAAVNDVCVVGLPAAATANLGFSCYVSAASAVKIRACNPTASGIDPDELTYAVRVFDP